MTVNTADFDSDTIHNFPVSENIDTRVTKTKALRRFWSDEFFNPFTSDESDRASL